MAHHVDINEECCKGCGLCIDVCPTQQLSLSGRFNSHGYNHIQAANVACRGCGLCYYACPEPGAITVHQERPDA